MAAPEFWTRMLMGGGATDEFAEPSDEVLARADGFWDSMLSGFSRVPTTVGRVGQKLATDFVNSTISGAQLPGDVYAGRVDPTSDEGIKRALDLSGLVGSGGFSRAAMSAPGPGEVELGVFGGRSAKTADLGALEVAMQAAEHGVDMNKIRRSTGWFISDDGKWRFEIGDQSASFVGDPYDFTGKMKDYLNHPDLYESYPDIGEMLVNVKPQYAIDRSTGNRIQGLYDKPDATTQESLTSFTGKPSGSFDDPDNIMSTMLHEIQHAIQGREGFTPGTNPQMAGGYDNYFNTIGEIEARNVEHRRLYTDDQRYRNSPYLLPRVLEYHRKHAPTFMADAPSPTPSASANAPMPMSATVAKQKSDAFWERMIRSGNAL